jgi:hypothetical protein
MTEEREAQAARVEAARSAARGSSRESDKAIVGLREAAEVREFGTHGAGGGVSDRPLTRDEVREIVREVVREELARLRSEKAGQDDPA